MRHASAGFRCFLRKMIFRLDYSAQETHPEQCPSMEKGVEEVDEGFSPLFYLGSQIGYVHRDDSH